MSESLIYFLLNLQIKIVYIIVVKIFLGIWKNALECGKKVITVEDHYVAGGINGPFFKLV